MHTITNETREFLDELGLEVPFAQGTTAARRFGTEPVWNESGESPFAEATAEPEDEGLAWLDREAADAHAEAFDTEDLALDGEELHDHDHAHDEEDESPLDETARESEYFDDEERDASESYEDFALQERFEPEAGATPASGALLTAQQRAWVLDLDRSAIERLPDAARRTRFLQQDWSGVEFPGNVPKGQSPTHAIKQHWALARSLFDAMAGVVPERRVPSSIRFRERAAVQVPGQPSQRLFAEARDAFVRMRAAAKAEGVDLVILSSWRSRARQAAASANQPNPAAVARKASAHMYGLAIDVRMGVPGLPVKEINTRVDRVTAAKAGTSAKMGNLVRMYRSPVYKWLSLRAREFGWYPYRNEPWHWEYNPPGLKARFEGTEAEQEDEIATSTSLRTFTAKALGVKVAVYVTQAARTARHVEMLVFAHGLDLCKPVLKNRPASFITNPPLKLGEIVETCGRPIVLVVPFLDWERLGANGMAFGRKWHRLAQPETFNQVAAEALEEARAITNSAAAPRLQRLILAGHSRAYGFFDALAYAHASPQMRAGALSCPTHVWALDTTYSAPIADWRAWLRSREDLRATVVFRHGRYQAKGSAAPRELTTGVRGQEFAKLAASGNGRLTVLPVAAGKVSHCAIPATYLPRLLAALPALATSGEEESEALHEAFEDTEDEAGLAAEAEEAAGSEWTEEAAGEEETDAPGRFDALGDHRDFEWDSESSEEMADSLADDEAPLSFALDQEEEAGLAGSGLTPAERKAVEITSLFETGKRGGFYGLSGNFDGQGLSFGLVNWTIGTGSLQPLLRDFAREHPARWLWVFGADAARFLKLIAGKDKAAQKEQHRFAVEQMNTVSTNARGKRIWTVRQPWVGYFKRLSEDAAFQRIQVRYVRNLLAQADPYCRHFQLKSEQAFCFMFDAVASHGKWWLRKKFGGVEKRRVLVEQALKTLAARFGAGRVPESEVLLAIADVLATTSAQRWADQVRRRKRWFVTGQHPRGRELDGLMPRANVRYTTSGARDDEA
jgi:D-alanyl-D-alanine dipeptidase